jgi:hypothetical protein
MLVEASMDKIGVYTALLAKVRKTGQSNKQMALTFSQALMVWIHVMRGLKKMHPCIKMLSVPVHEEGTKTKNTSFQNQSDTYCLEKKGCIHASK